MSATLTIPLSGTAPILPSPQERRRIRERASLRLEDVAALLRVGTSTVSRWEHAHVEPHGSARVLYAALLTSLAGTETLNADTPPEPSDGASPKTDIGGLRAPGYRY
jgi:transcriptional regulator with XRE-family HTH domain